MNVGKAVYGILSSTSAVTDIVGTNIFPEIAEQETATPFIVYQLQGVSPEDTHDGPSKLDEVRMEIICFSDSYNGAADLADKVRGALDRVSGTYNGVNVESVQFNNVDIEIEYDPRRYSQVTTYTFRIKRDDITIAAGTPVTGAQLGDLSDVNTTGVTDGQLIAYDANTQVWLPATDAGGVTLLSQLSDVTLSGLQTGQTLIYNHSGSPRGFFNGNQSLEDLTDTSIANPSNQAFLRYVNGVWIAEPVAIPNPPPTSTDGLPEGSTNEYFTEARVSANTDVAANTSKIATVEEGAQVNAVTSVNTETGAVVLDTDDIAEGTTNEYFTDAKVAANSAVTANTAKVGITTGQADAITANTAKISYTDASAVAANTAKNSYPSADASKLAGIEASADVTDATNVTAAGALMDSEVTNLAQVKAFDASDYATAAQGTTANSALQNISEDTTPQLGGELDTNSKNILFTKTAATDYSSNGEIIKIGSGSTTQGALHYFNSSGGWSLADADATGTAGGVLLALALGTDPDIDGMLLRGMFTLDHDTGTIGDELYVSTTAGEITSVAPAATNDIVRIVGYCLDSSNGQIYFNPSNDFIELS